VDGAGQYRYVYRTRAGQATLRPGESGP
jgi:hypothetical protein